MQAPLKSRSLLGRIGPILDGRVLTCFEGCTCNIHPFWGMEILALSKTWQASRVMIHVRHVLKVKQSPQRVHKDMINAHFEKRILKVLRGSRNLRFCFFFRGEGILNTMWAHANRLCTDLNSFGKAIARKYQHCLFVCSTPPSGRICFVSLCPKQHPLVSSLFP